LEIQGGSYDGRLLEKKHNNDNSGEFGDKTGGEGNTNSPELS